MGDMVININTAQGRNGGTCDRVISPLSILQNPLSGAPTVSAVPIRPLHCQLIVNNQPSTTTHHALTSVD